MKKAFLLTIIMLLTLAATAQPPARRGEQQAKAKTKNVNNTITTRAQISFPTAQTMDENVVWRRDIYRQLMLTDDANAGLYYPVEPVGGQMNLFTYMFKLMMRGAVPAYEYRLDGNELFTDSARIKPLAFLDNYHIYYERTGRGIHLDDSDIPSREVTSYYVKESSYYDQATATFHTQVIALCPILMREDDFGDASTPYPLFWMKYDDLAPYLTRQTIMTSNLNNAATMSLDDYFTKTKYSGKIYKTTNMLGQTLAQYCQTDSALTAEQQRIEREVAAFEKNLWGDPAVKDSLDSIAKLDKKELKTSKKSKNSAKTTRRSTTKVKKSKSSKSSSSSGAARVTVRRERH